VRDTHENAVPSSGPASPVATTFVVPVAGDQRKIVSQGREGNVNHELFEGGEAVVLVNVEGRGEIGVSNATWPLLFTKKFENAGVMGKPRGL